MNICFSLIALTFFFGLPSSAALPLPTYPDWESNPGGRVATGLGVADLDGDGWVDLLVANGNDMARQRLAVYRNQGDGTYPPDPTWMSDDIDYHGHLDLADVDGDGNIDCAVAVYIGAGGFSYPGRVKLYRGNGDGTFSSFPVWQSDDSFYCFSVAFGDLDTDGWPDLACATGDDYYANHEEYRRVYRNIGGQLEDLPSWMSTEYECSLDVVWADFNSDGALDLAFAGTSNPNRVYFSQSGSLPMTAGWSSADASVYANTLTAGDVNDDGWIDLAVADNSQLGGSGRSKLYSNLGGNLATTPTWQSTQGGYGSHVSFIDIDEDGDLDLATGMWWGPVRIFENIAGSLTTTPSYQSVTNSVIENEVWEDFDNDGLQSGLDATWWGDGSRRLFLFPQRPVRSLLSVTVDGVPVAPSDVTLDSDDAWMILPDAPAEHAQVWAAYVSSADVDLAVSNWDDDIGDYVFYNLRNPAGIDPVWANPVEARLCVGPNPSSGTVRLWLDGGIEHVAGTCEVMDLSGRRIMAWPRTEGTLLWDGRDERNRVVAPGVYWARWTLPGHRSILAKVARQ